MACKSEISSTQFPSKTQLMSYKRSHQTEKLYKCDKCVLHNEKVQHQIIHTGKKAFKCNENVVSNLPTGGI